MRIEDRVRLSELLSEYGGLLTEKQRTMLREHCELDLSLFEIAEQYCISRQAVRDNLLRAERQLQEYEKILKNVELKSKINALAGGSAGDADCSKRLLAIKELLEG